jgi:hypothetical protein
MLRFPPQQEIHCVLPKHFLASHFVVLKYANVMASGDVTVIVV